VRLVDLFLQSNQQCRYTDDSFTTKVERSEEEAYLGLLGPVLHAEVGDKMRVLLSNKCSLPITFHTHGLHYDKGHEGAPLDDGTSGMEAADDHVPPGGSHIYKCAQLSLSLSAVISVCLFVCMCPTVFSVRLAHNCHCRWP
jgi:hypothetical protein